MPNLIWIILLTLGTAQGLFLGLTLISVKVPNRARAASLGLMSLVLSLLIGCELVERLPVGPAMALSGLLAINLELLLGPLVLFLARSCAQPQAWVSARDGVHALPFLSGLTLWSVLTGLGLIGDGISIVFVTAKALVFGTYLWFAFKVSTRPAVLIPIARQRAVDLRTWLYLFGATAGFCYLSFYLDAFGLPGIPDSDLLSAMAVTMAIYGFSGLAIRHPRIFAAVPRTGPDDDALAREACRFFEKAKGHRDPELTLKTMAASVGTSEGRLSALIRSRFGCRFSDLVNHYRLRDLSRWLRQARHSDSDLMHLALDAGFGSKATLYRVFKKAYGISPHQYRQSGCRVSEPV